MKVGLRKLFHYFFYCSSVWMSAQTRSKFRLGAMDSIGQVGDNFVFFVRFDPSMFTDRFLHNFYVQVFSKHDHKVYLHCLTTAQDEEVYPVKFFDERMTQINTPRSFSRVRVFQFPMLEKGTFKVTVRPTSGGVDNPQTRLDRENPDFNWVEITVTSATDDLCLLGAAFTLSVENTTIHSSTHPSSKHVVKLQRGSHILVKRVDENMDCKSLPGHIWTLTKISQQAPDSKATFPPQCYNYRRISTMNISALAHHFLKIPVPFPMDLPTFTIPSFLLPPGGYFRLCGKFSNMGGSHIVCAYIETEYYDVADFVRVVVSPADESFVWPKADLHIDASQSYFIYELVESGYFLHKSMKFSWTCTGDAKICQKIILQQQYDKHFVRASANDTVIHTTARHIYINKEWIEYWKSIHISLEVSFTYSIPGRLETFRKLVVRDVTFVDSEGVDQGWIKTPHIYIRCLINCWYYTDMGSQILLGLGCTNCEEFVPEEIKIKWTVDTGWRADTEGSDTFYFYISDFRLIQVQNVTVHLDFSYTTSSGDIVKSMASRKFKIPIEQLGPSSYAVIAQEQYIPGLRDNVTNLLIQMKEPIAKRIHQLHPFLHQTSIAGTTSNAHDLVILRSLSMPASLLLEPSTENRIIKDSVLSSTGHLIRTYKKGIAARQLVIRNITLLYRQFRSTLTAGVTHLWTISALIEKNYANNAIEYRQLVMKILHDMSRSVGIINYSNVDLILAILERFLRLGDNSLEKVSLILALTDKVVDLHRRTRHDPIGDEAIFSLEVNVLDSIKDAIIDAVSNEIVGADDFKVFLLSDGLMVTLEKVINYFAKSVGKRFPVQAKIKHLVESKVTAVWFDTSVHKEFSIGDFNTDSHLHVVTGNYRMLQHDLAVDCFVNVAIYTSKLSPFDTRYSDFPVNLPLMMLSVHQKQPKQFTLNTEYRNIYDVRLKMSNQEDIMETNTFKLKVKLKKDVNAGHVIVDSDCLLLKAKMCHDFGSVIHIVSNFSIEATVEPHKLLKGALDLFDGSFVQLPRESKTDLDLSIHQDTVFLPKLTLKQSTLMDGGHYYILIRFKTMQVVETKDLPSLVDETMEDEITLKCVRLMCVEWKSYTQSWSTRYCYPTVYSLGKSEHLNCRCDTGKIFSGGYSPCLKDPNVLWDDFTLSQVDLLDIGSRKLIVAVFILAMWFIFVALMVWSAKRDRLDASLRKTFVMPRVFSWSQGDQYLVCIVTGWRHGCGTRLSPTLTIIGSTDVSFAYVLFPHQEMFKTGSEVWFILSCSEDIGTLESVVLSLPQATYKDAWHVSHIFFRNLRTKEDRYCICDAWIPDASNRVNFIVKPVTPVPGRRIRSFIFKLMYFFRALHVIVGIMFSNQTSSFNKTQHVLCCFLTLLIAMLFCVWATDAVEMELKGDLALTAVEKHYKNLALEVNISAVATSIVSFCIIVWFEVISFLPNYEVLHWPMKFNFDQSPDVNQDIDLNQNGNVNQGRDVNQSRDSLDGDFESTGRLMGLAYRRSLASLQFGSITSPRASQYNNLHRRSRPSLPSLRSTLTVSERPSGQDTKLSPSISELLLVNISMGEAIFRQPIKSKNWHGYVRVVSVSVLVLLLVFLSFLVASLGTRIESSGYYLMVSLMTFAVVVGMWHPVFIVLVSFLFAERYHLGRSDADARVKAWAAQMYTHCKMLDLEMVASKRTVSYKHTYIPIAKKYIYRKHCAQIRKRSSLGTILNEEQGETGARRINLFVFIAVVVIIINLQSGSVSQRYMQTNFMRNLLEVGREEFNLRQGINYSEFWDHLRWKFHLITHWTLSNTNTTTSFKTVSSVRVRQIRAAAYKGNCEKDFAHLPNQRCHFDIEQSDIETRRFALTWKKVTHRKIRPGPFTHVQGNPFETVNHAYPGGGYDAMYSVIEKNPDIIDFLKTKDWVDERTRAVNVEVALFNADTKLLTSIVHVYEFTAAGIFQDTPHVYSFPLFYQPASSVFLRGCILLLFIFTLIHSVNDAKDVYYQGLYMFLTRSMAWINLLERGACFTVIIMFVLEYDIRKTSVASVQDIYFENKDSETFIDFSAVSDISFKITLLSCLLATIIFIRVINQLTYIPSLAQFLKLIPPVLRISYLPIVTILYFSILGYFIFVEFEEFYTYRSSAFTITVMMLNLNIVKPLKESYATMGPLFVTVVMSILNYIVLNYFIILLNEQYSEICAIAALLNKGKRVNILQDLLKMIKPPKMRVEQEVAEQEVEEDEKCIVLPEDPKYESDVLEWLDRFSSSEESLIYG